MFVFVCGGVRSGKSSFAEEYAVSINKGRLVYGATSIPYDEEMKERVKRHRENRGDKWLTIEKSSNLHEIANRLKKEDTLLIDCLTIWLSNEMFGEKNSKDIVQDIVKQIEVLKDNVDNLIIVSNDIFRGISNYSKETEDYMKKLGSIHIELVKVCDEAYECIYGIPVKRR